MKKDDNSKHVDLDLDALNDSPLPSKGVLLPKAKTNYEFTVGELDELRKKDPSTLTDVQKTAIDTLDKSAESLVAAINKVRDGTIGADIKRLMENIPKVPTLPSFDYDMPALVAPVSPPTSTEQIRQTALLTELVDKLGKQQQADHADIKNLLRPHYYADKKLLVFRNRLIDVTKGKEYEAFCKIMFRSGEPRSKPIQFGDLLDKLGVHDTKDTAHIRNLVNNFNNFIAKETTISDLFYARKLEVYFEAKYL
jgi:hypothetical protein